MNAGSCTNNLTAFTGMFILRGGALLEFVLICQDWQSSLMIIY